jgi:hypothetical protein
MADSLLILDYPDQIADSNFTSSLIPVCLSAKSRERKIGGRLIYLSDKGIIACQILSYGHKRQGADSKRREIRDSEYPIPSSQNSHEAAS